MSDNNNESDSQFAADVDTLVEMVRSEGRPTPEHLEAAGRVVRHTIVGIGSIADSLRRIADAQDRAARISGVTHHPTGREGPAMGGGGGNRAPRDEPLF